MRGVVQHVTGERDQALSDLAALRDTLVQQQEDSTRRVRGGFTFEDGLLHLLDVCFSLVSVGGASGKTCRGGGAILGALPGGGLTAD